MSLFCRQPNYCRDCRHHKSDFGGGHWCHNPKAMDWDYVAGSQQPLPCSQVRFRYYLRIFGSRAHCPIFEPEIKPINIPPGTRVSGHPEPEVEEPSSD